VSWQQVLDLIYEKPFQPFSIHLSDGRTFLVERANQCLASPAAVHVGIPDSGRDFLMKDVVIFSPDTIASLKLHEPQGV
jgi:hypothetical protein